MARLRVKRESIEQICISKLYGQNMISYLVIKMPVWLTPIRQLISVIKQFKSYFYMKKTLHHLKHSV